MGEVVRFVPKPELERARLIREARATYESIYSRRRRAPQARRRSPATLVFSMALP
jgi:hypothetical protein